MRHWTREEWRDLAGFCGFLLLAGGCFVAIAGIREGWLLP